MYKLLIEDDEGKTTVVPLIRDEITIGRKEGNTIRLTERNVSRRHAKLVKSNGSILIEDLQSHNGIKINGDRIAGRSPVAEGDRIQIGDYQLALKLDKSQSAPQGTPQPVREDEKTVPFDKEAGKAEAQTALNPVVSPDGAEQPARLVVVSSNFAGQEFLLDKAAVVIGRTDENDVVVNHRSISRHHAKIVREAGHYHVVDLQSANGVRVNGEEYGKVELRKGDHIDLGHVRMRFVAPGEDFVFERDAKIVDVAGDKKGKGMLVAIIAVAVVVLGGGGFAIVKMLGNKGGGGEKVGGDTEMQVLKLNSEVDKAMKALDWEKAIADCTEGLALDHGNDTLRDKKTKAESERKNKEKYDEFIKASKVPDYDRAVTAYQEFTDDSIYRDKALDTYNLVKRAYIKDHLQSARAAQVAGKCDDARKHVEAVLLIPGEEGNEEAQQIAKKCGVTAAAPRPRTPTVHTDKKQPEVRQPTVKQPEVKQPEVKQPPTVAPQGEDTEKQLNEAMDDYVNGRYVAAVEKARKANKNGSNPKAWRIIGASACYQKNKDEAIKAWNRLGQMDRQFVKYICNRNEITIP